MMLPPAATRAHGVNPDPASDPMFVLLAWAGGVSLAAAYATARGVVGPGFTWLGAATAVLVGVWPALGGEVAAAVAAAAAAGGGALVKRTRPLAAMGLGVGAVLFLVGAARLGGAWPALTASLALGGITGEMLLGHWYLVDPTLPRRILRVLAVAGLGGAALDAWTVAAVVGLPSRGLLTVAFWALAATTIVLMGAVLGALRHPAYSGVMAATGLSYLAVLTGLAFVFVGRMLGSGPV